MTSFLKTSILCVTLSALTVFAGCSKKSDNWLIGKWAYDSQATKANLPADNSAKGVPDKLAKQMGEQLTNQLLSQMKNVKLDITADKITFTSADGSKKSSSYKIDKQPDANTIIITGEESATFTKSGKYICIPTTGAVQFNMYFMPVK